MEPGVERCRGGVQGSYETSLSLVEVLNSGSYEVIEVVIMGRDRISRTHTRIKEKFNTKREKTV